MGTDDVTETPRHSVSVAAAIFDERGENVLLIKRRDNGHWEPPGGVLELAETVEDGLRREVREETGAEIEIGPLTGVYKNMPIGIIALVFRCSLAPNTTFKPETGEASEVQWQPLRALPGSMAPAFAVRLEDASMGNRAVVRHHDGISVMDDRSR